jgi:hypothetical protein
MDILMKYNTVLALLLMLPLSAAADHYSPRTNHTSQRTYYGQPAIHAGQMDTDGILSAGEIRNPNIDYAQVKRWSDRYGDTRYQNPYNNAAAIDSRGKNYAWRNNYRDYRDYRDYGRPHTCDTRDHYPRYREPTRWWNW